MSSHQPPFVMHVEWDSVTLGSIPRHSVIFEFPDGRQEQRFLKKDQVFKIARECGAPIKHQ